MIPEEKTEIYDEALRRAKIAHKDEDSHLKAVLEGIFPELKDDEDERIRKEILDCFRAMKQQGCFPSKHKEQYDSWIAWLEKQGEQKPQGKTALEAINEEKVDNHFCVKPVDKAEPKFHEDWIISNKDKSDYHLWSIKDAKDGDVLVYDNSIFIFNRIYKNWLIYYGIYKNDKFRNDKCYSYLDLDIIDSNIIHPATKEQRDLIFNKMHEAGYELDVEKEQLRTIECNKPNFCHHEVDLSNCSEEYRKAYYDGWNNCNQQYSQLKVEQTSIWDENDDIMLHNIIDYFENRTITLPYHVWTYIPWLKSLRNKVNCKANYISTKEWSEDDEKKRNLLIDILNVNHPNGVFKVNPANTLNMEAMHKDELVSWLKALGPQNAWNPSDAQMIALNDIITNGHLSNANERILKGLQEQLKKLKGE